MVDRFLIYMTSRKWFGAATMADRILGTFEGTELFGPTHWTAEDGAAARAYERDDVLAALRGDNGRNSASVQLLRKQAPQYRAHLATAREGLNHLKLTAEGSVAGEVMTAAFKLGDALAGLLQPEYGLVHAWQAGSDRKGYRLSGFMTFFDLQKTGPRPPAARTWTGRHIGELDVAGFVIEEAGARRTPWGGRVFDLLPEPWSADEADLAAAQAALIEKLRPCGIWGDYSGIVPRRGPKWKPVGEQVI